MQNKGITLTNERARKFIDNDSVRLNKIQFFLHFYPQFPLHQGPAHLNILVYCKKYSLYCVCPLIDDDFSHNIVKIEVKEIFTELVKYSNLSSSEASMGFGLESCWSLRKIFLGISFSSILYPQFTRMIFIIYTSHCQNSCGANVMKKSSIRGQTHKKLTPIC